VFYGQLDHILVCNIPDDAFWEQFSNTTRLFAVITPCTTEGRDASSQVVSYTQMTTQIVTDIQTISAVVGRVQTRRSWGIIDRAGEDVHPAFVDPEGE
jgi:hypothetical protein